MNRKPAVYNACFFSIYSGCMLFVFSIMWEEISDVSRELFEGCGKFLVISACVAVLVSGVIAVGYIKGSDFLDEYQYGKVCLIQRFVRAAVIILFIIAFATIVITDNVRGTIVIALIAGWICLLVGSIMELIITKKK